MRAARYAESSNTTVKKSNAGRIAALILIFAALLFLIFNLDKFSSYRAYVDGEYKNIFDDSYKVKVSKDYVSLEGTKAVRQQFTAEDTTISMIGLSYFCVRNDNRTGSLSVGITDKEGKVLMESDVDIYSLTKRDLNMISLQDSDEGNLKVNKGDTYYLVIQSENLRTDEGFGLYKPKTGKGICSAVVYSRTKKKVIALYLILILLAAEAVLVIPGRDLRRKSRRQDMEGAGAVYQKRTADNALLRLMFFVTPFMCYLLAVKITGRSFRDCGMSLFTYGGLVNMLVIGCLWWIIYTISGRKKITVIGMTLLNLVFLLINFALIQFRSTPFLFNDVQEIKTAAMVARSYRMVPDQHALCVIILSLLWMAVAFALKENKHIGLKARLAVLLAAVVWGAGVYHVVWDVSGLGKHNIILKPFDPLTSYNNNGYYICFMISVRKALIEKPEGYSAGAVRDIAGRYESDKAEPVTRTTESTPNIIVVMNESFSDLEMLGKIQTDEKILPFYHSLKENAIKGTMYSSVYGGHTAVSEFEFLTGNTQRFLPVNSVPYTGFITSDMPSFAWDLKKRGYGGITAFHPGYASSYNRDNVYPLLGFDEHISSESMVDPDRVRSFISDKQDYERLIEEYEKYRAGGETRPYFMFNVTIQNHGGYALENGEVEPKQIEITDSELHLEELGQFLNLMKISDQEFEKLIKYFSKVKEPTIILMYGDHQPHVENKFYNTMASRKGNMSEVEKQVMKYKVPFVIWANYDIPEQKNVEISANYLQTFLLDTIGAPKTGYQKYLAELRTKLPVICDSCTIDKDGHLYSRDEESPYDDLLEEYSILQYNMIRDKNHLDKEFFSLK